MGTGDCKGCLKVRIHVVSLQVEGRGVCQHLPGRFRLGGGVGHIGGLHRRFDLMPQGTYLLTVQLVRHI